MHRIRRGAYGAGLYFSEKAEVATGYTGNRVNQVLLCKLLIGKEYRIGGSRPSGPNPGNNAPLQDGFDSHLVQDGNMVVIFDPDQVLPCYVVHYESV